MILIFGCKINMMDFFGIWPLLCIYLNKIYNSIFNLLPHRQTLSLENICFTSRGSFPAASSTFSPPILIMIMNFTRATTHRSWKSKLKQTPQMFSQCFFCTEHIYTIKCKHSRTRQLDRYPPYTIWVLRCNCMRFILI